MVKLSTAVYCFIATLAIPGLAATVSDLSSAIADVVAKTKAQDALLTTIKTGSQVDLPTAAKLVADAQAVVTSVDKVTSTVKSLTAADIAPTASNILTQFKGIEPGAAKALTSLVNKKPSFANVPGSSTIISATLKSLGTSIQNMETALLAKTPANLASQVKSLQANLNTAYMSAVKAYAN